MLALVHDGTPETTRDLLVAAARVRSVPVRHVEASAFRFATTERLPPGAALFRTAGSSLAIDVEHFLWATADAPPATFYKDSPYFACISPELAFRGAGLTVPRSAALRSTDRRQVEAVVAALGGFPVVVKCSGGEGGVGVFRADDLRTLLPLLDFLVRGRGETPRLLAYVGDAIHQRVIVVGDRAVASYINPTAPNDFRSEPSGDRADYTDRPEPRLADAAVRAANALRVAFAGVDLLVHRSGRIYVLEANFPCYFAQVAEVCPEFDVAGAMLDALLPPR
jgi:hypothetical protein